VDDPFRIAAKESRMPTIKLQNHDFVYERISADGRLTAYQVKIRRKGFPHQTQSFDDLDEADRFVRQVLHDQDKGHKVDRLAGHRKTAGAVIDDAIDDLVSGRRRIKGVRDELYRLRAFRRREIHLCGTAMAELTEDMFEDWLEQRLEEVKPSTALREIRQFRPIFKDAARQLSLPYAPMSFLKNPRVLDERIRRIEADEEALLFAELAKAQDPIVPLAADFALEAGCRRSEQLRVEWRDYDRKRGTIWLQDAKNGRGRHILLTLRAQEILEAVPGRAEGGTIFKVTGNLLKKAFEYGRQRAGENAVQMGRTDLVEVSTLRWHDLRHEAISRCFDAGWTSEQVMDFSVTSTSSRCCATGIRRSMRASHACVRWSPVAGARLPPPQTLSGELSTSAWSSMPDPSFRRSQDSGEGVRDFSRRRTPPARTALTDWARPRRAGTPVALPRPPP
jgi:integrase